jgi:hypothetical protein
MLFRKRKKQNISNGLTVHDKAATRIAVFFTSLQNRFACFMNTKINKLSNQSKKIWLVAFCSLSGAITISTLVYALSTPGLTIPEPVRFPKYYHSADSKTSEPLVTGRDVMRIQNFKVYLDSLTKSVPGKALYDSIMRARPGLVDSIRVCQELYSSQQK